MHVMSTGISNSTWTLILTYWRTACHMLLLGIFDLIRKYRDWSVWKGKFGALKLCATKIQISVTRGILRFHCWCSPLIFAINIGFKPNRVNHGLFVRTIAFVFPFVIRRDNTNHVTLFGTCFYPTSCLCCLHDVFVQEVTLLAGFRFRGRFFRVMCEER